MAIGLSMVAGVADVIRLPNWAWKKAEEPKVAYAALVGLLPVVGLGMYMVRARPKAKAVIAAGRAASLPFERFGDGAPPMDEEQVAEAPEPIAAGRPSQATSLISAPLALAVAQHQPKADEEPKQDQPEAEPAAVGAGTFFSSQSVTATATRTLRLPTSLTSRTYHPRQRASLSEGRITPAVPAGWKADPTGRHQFRYWNGSHWTENVADAGVQDATRSAPDFRLRRSDQAWFEPGGSSRRRPGPTRPGSLSVWPHGLSDG